MADSRSHVPAENETAYRATRAEHADVDPREGRPAGAGGGAHGAGGVHAARRSAPTAVSSVAIPVALDLGQPPRSSAPRSRGRRRTQGIDQRSQAVAVVGVAREHVDERSAGVRRASPSGAGRGRGRTQRRRPGPSSAALPSSPAPRRRDPRARSRRPSAWWRTIAGSRPRRGRQRPRSTARRPIAPGLPVKSARFTAAGAKVASSSRACASAAYRLRPRARARGRARPGRRALGAVALCALGGGVLLDRPGAPAPIALPSAGPGQRRHPPRAASSRTSRTGSSSSGRRYTGPRPPPHTQPAAARRTSGSASPSSAPSARARRPRPGCGHAGERARAGDARLRGVVGEPEELLRARPARRRRRRAAPRRTPGSLASARRTRPAPGRPPTPRRSAWQPLQVLGVPERHRPVGPAGCEAVVVADVDDHVGTRPACGTRRTRARPSPPRGGGARAPVAFRRVALQAHVRCRRRAARGRAARGSRCTSRRGVDMRLWRNEPTSNTYVLNLPIGEIERLVEQGHAGTPARWARRAGRRAQLAPPRVAARAGLDLARAVPRAAAAAVSGAPIDVPAHPRRSSKSTREPLPRRPPARRLAPRRTCAEPGPWHASQETSISANVVAYRPVAGS